MKKQIKKSLSLMLAVLMVLSCWVWVAPTKAEAAAGYYPLKLGVTVSNAADNNKSLVGFKVDYITNNGTGTAVTNSIEKQFYASDYPDLKSGGANVVFDMGEIPGFPTKVIFYIMMNNGANVTDFEVIFNQI